ncbi:hypothetical protein C7974DRAFT_212675 [Boeremia exigua]|uniref:uncharacterized protein n=1 Tax=Boeremia exigua TaxID=749465 RepID=UPI001E8E5B25|nr:uncharacterized protein C7974DRAFT_212675 [Boeremia exigua]KAH6621887.1 hypothetical protein C7974DRAFT_212675 [Boeremia exigua]
MASASEPPSSRKRLGRRRLPPLEPGPPFQFVTANHPDQFRAGKTMRHVRSHVMYKHRIERKPTPNERTNTNLQRSELAHVSSTSSPGPTSQGEYSSDPDYLAPHHSRPRSSTWTGDSLPSTPYCPSPATLRSLIHQILTSSQVAYARSAPPIFEDASAFPFPGFHGMHSSPIDGLKQRYIESCGLFGEDREWMRTVCADQTSFLSHVSVSSVYQDLAEGFWQDSDMTVEVKTHALSAIAGQLESNDATILSILHLLLSEVGGDGIAFKVHHLGLQSLINRRGGLSQLGTRLATYITL